MVTGKGLNQWADCNKFLEQLPLQAVEQWCSVHTYMVMAGDKEHGATCEGFAV